MPPITWPTPNATQPWSPATTTTQQRRLIFLFFFAACVFAVLKLGQQLDEAQIEGITEPANSQASQSPTGKEQVAAGELEIVKEQEQLVSVGSPLENDEMTSPSQGDEDDEEDEENSNTESTSLKASKTNLNENANEGEEDEEPNGNWTRSDFLLPRSYHGAYSTLEKGVRYFLYSPSGGFNNQRMEMEYALMIGRFLNRTVLVPQIGKHTQFWRKYEELKPRHLFPMDRVVDFVQLRKFHPCVPLDVPLMQFWKKCQADLGPEKLTYVHHEESLNWAEWNLRPFLANKKRILFFHGAEMYHVWWGGEKMREVRHLVRYTPILRDAALKLVLGKFSAPGQFNAVHVRLGDYSSRTPSSALFEKRCKGAGFTPDVPLYVATEPNPPKGFFDTLCKPTGTFQCVFSKQMDPKILQQFKAAFPPGQIRNDMLGLVEQLVCTAAKGFVGTGYSTFSYAIAFMRKNRGNLFPELLKYRENNQWITIPVKKSGDSKAIVLNRGSNSNAERKEPSSFKTPNVMVDEEIVGEANEEELGDDIVDNNDKEDVTKDPSEGGKGEEEAERRFM